MTHTRKSFERTNLGISKITKFIYHQNCQQLMSGRNGVIEILNDIKIELEKQLTAKNNNEINMGKLLQLSSLMPNRLIDSDFPSQTKDSLIRFSNTINDEATTHENLKMRLYDVNKILGILSQN